MKKTPLPHASAVQRDSFTIIELMVVIAIATALMSLSITAFHGIGDSQALAVAETKVGGALEIARQISMTRNKCVQFRFYRFSSESNYICLGMAVWDDNAQNPDGTEGDYVLEGRLEFLPEGYVIYDSERYSKLFHLEQPNDLLEGEATILKDQSAKYKYFLFYPTGTTDIGDTNGMSHTFVTIVQQRKIGAGGNLLPKNFVTVSIDPATGRTETRRP